MSFNYSQDMFDSTLDQTEDPMRAPQPLQAPSPVMNDSHQVFESILAEIEEPLPARQPLQAPSIVIDDSHEVFDSILDNLEKPLAGHQGSQPSSLLSNFIEEVKIRMSHPKKSPKPEIKSKVFESPSVEIPQNYHSLVQSALKINAKQISSLRYYKNLPSISEEIALCYLILLDLQIPKSHYWEHFALSLSRPGMFIQLLRHLPFYLESECDIDSLSKVQHVFQSIPKTSLKLESRFFEFQLLVNLMREIVSCIKIPEYTPKPVKKVKIPTSTKNKTAKKAEFFSEEEVLRSYDAGLLREVVEEQSKQVRILKGQLLKQQWEETRYLKEEKGREEQREMEREIDIKRNTENEFFRNVRNKKREQKIIEHEFNKLKFSELREIKKDSKKKELLEVKAQAEENYASMKWDQQLAKGKDMKNRSENHQVFLNHVLDKRDYQQLEKETLKIEQDRQRSEDLSSTLKHQYKSLLDDKSKLLKTLSLYRNY